MMTTSSSLELPISPFCFRRHSWVWYVEDEEEGGDQALFLLLFTVWLCVWFCVNYMSPRN